jgi:ribonuclease HI
MPVKLYVDAGSDTERATPASRWACGAVLEFAGGFVEAGRRLPAGTVNEAEYRGLLFGLDLAKRFGATDLEVYADSQLMVRQINGQYQCRKEHLQRLLEQVRQRLVAFDSVEFRWLPRAQNARADSLARRVFMERW